MKTEAARGTLTYSRMRGMVAILIGERRRQAALRRREREVEIFGVPDHMSVCGIGCDEAV